MMSKCRLIGLLQGEVMQALKRDVWAPWGQLTTRGEWTRSASCRKSSVSYRKAAWCQRTVGHWETELLHSCFVICQLCGFGQVISLSLWNLYHLTEAMRRSSKMTWVVPLPHGGWLAKGQSSLLPICDEMLWSPESCGVASVEGDWGSFHGQLLPMSKDILALSCQ